MSTDRPGFAIRSGGLALPEQGRIALYGMPGDAALDNLPADRCRVVQPFRPDFDAWQARGLPVGPALDGGYAAVIVTLPRARDLAELRIARACRAAPGGLIVLDGAKTDGIEAIGKALKTHGIAFNQVSKAHGKCLWFAASPALADAWDRPDMAPNADGDHVAPGVFSADGPDPGSQRLADALPDRLPGHIADLGAGWGWLSREILRRESVQALHLVEAEHAALDCARVNITDPRAVFHWADATRWHAPQPLDAVIMNPPFHVGRKGDPGLGQTFIAAAARLLAPHGTLWLVANRHLPYETALSGQFRDLTELAGTPQFKVLKAARPSRPRR